MSEKEWKEEIEDIDEEHISTEEDYILKEEKIEKDANEAHYEVGSKIRNTIKELGGTMPEYLPTPEKSLKQLERENKQSLIK